MARTTTTQQQQQRAIAHLATVLSPDELDKLQEAAKRQRRPSSAPAPRPPSTAPASLNAPRGAKAADVLLAGAPSARARLHGGLTRVAALLAPALGASATRPPAEPGSGAPGSVAPDDGLAGEPAQCCSVPKGDELQLARARAAFTDTCPTCGTVNAPQVLDFAPWNEWRVRRRICACVLALEAAEAEAARLAAREQRRAEHFFHGARGASRYKRYARMRLQRWEPTRHPDEYAAFCRWAHEAAQAYAGGELANLPNVLLVGPIGAGKTHLLAGIAHALLDADVRVLFASALEVLEAIKDSWDATNPEQEERIIARLVNAPVLLLDDVGYQPRPRKVSADLYAVGTAHWAQKIYYRILDGRYIHMRPTLINGRSAESVVLEMGDAAFDRLMDNGGVVTLPEETASYRLTRTRAITAHALSLPQPAASASPSVSRAERDYHS